MKRIPLTQGKFAIVDDKDYERLNKYKWYAAKNKRTFYAMRTGSIYMHRQILGLLLEQQCDHRNHNGLDNRKQNLRICTIAQNYYNQLHRKGYSSQFRGVYWEARKNKWRAQIGHNYKHYYLGFFKNEVEAARAYDKKAKELFGEFANTNFSSPSLTRESALPPPVGSLDFK